MGNGWNKANKKYGVYQYQDILEAFANRGYTVISEHRAETKPKPYANVIMKQVDRLIAKGVSSENIVVSGFSKGGQMTLLAAAINTHPELRFVVMAGCGKGTFRRGFERFLKEDAASMTGRMLSLYDAQDQDTGTCEDAFAKAHSLTSSQDVLHVGLGHGTFYTPNPAWLDKVTSWVGFP
jgi:hypothetical protein